MRWLRFRGVRPVLATSAVMSWAAVLPDVGAITYLYTFPPGTPKDRVRMFRQAFQATMKDPEFVAEAKKGNFELDPVAGEELEKIVQGFFKADPTTVNRLRELLK